MKNLARVLVALSLSWFISCSETATESATVVADQDSDAEIALRVESALRNASDLPQGIDVQVSEGQVLISGSLQCEDCGGMRTPGNTGTIQQSLGAVVRAVPGVTEVNFELDYSL